MKKTRISIYHKTKKETYKKIPFRLVMKIICIGIFLLHSGFVKSQQISSDKDTHENSTELTQTIRGVVIERNSGVKIPGANIVVLNTEPLIGNISDVDGNFRLENVPIGRHNIMVTFIGYEDLLIPEIMVGSAKEVILNVQLTESINQLSEVKITPIAKGVPNNEMAVISARSFSVEETKRYAAGVSDPGRMALSYAGVNTSDDLSNQIVVRGNSPNGMIWRIEGVQIPVPNHFFEEGYDAGYVSILSSNMMGNSDFYTGAFPAEYGNGTSGVFDITLRNGNNEKREGSFEIGLLGADLSLEGPISKNYKGSYLLNARYSTFSIINLAMDVLGGDILPEYSDLSYKINLPTKKFGTFSLWGLGGLGTIKDEPVADSTEWVDEWERFGDITKTRMGAAGLSHNYFVDSKSYFKTVISFSGNGSIYDSYELDSNYMKQYDCEERFSSSALRLSTMYNRKLSSRLTMRTGFIMSKLYYDYYSLYMDTNNVWINDANSKGNTETYQGYIQFKYKVNDKFHINAGGHYLNLALNGNQSLEPRIGFKWFLKNSQTISAGFGVHSKHEQLMRYFIKVPDINGNYYCPNKKLDLVKSNHYVLGYSKTLKKDMRFTAETYYQYLYNVPVAPDPLYTYSSINDEALWESMVNKGTGRNYGVELSLEKFFTNSYYFLTTLSLYNAEYKPLDNDWYNSQYNNNFITNLTGGKEFKVKENNILSLNTRILVSGGKRGTPLISGQLSDDDYIRIYEKSRNSIKYRSYFRADIGIKYKINKPKVSHEFGLDVQNVTNHQNVAYVYKYTDDEGETHEIEATLQGILPFVHYKIEF